MKFARKMDTNKILRTYYLPVAENIWPADNARKVVKLH